MPFLAAHWVDTQTLVAPLGNQWTWPSCRSISFGVLGPCQSGLWLGPMHPSSLRQSRSRSPPGPLDKVYWEFPALAVWVGADPGHVVGRTETHQWIGEGSHDSPEHIRELLIPVTALSVDPQHLDQRSIKSFHESVCLGVVASSVDLPSSS